MMQIEICANSLASAKAAQQAGADRIELCSELGVGGVTPSFGLVKKVLEELTIPVFVLIRPRSGDFVYHEDEIAIMVENIKTYISLGVKGIVSGVLTPDFEIDVIKTKELIEAAAEVSFTFHRAFDWIKDPLKALKQLEELKVDRILTSGQRVNVTEGFDNLIAFKNQTSINIMPGGGVNAQNISNLKKAGFQQIHFSGTTKELRNYHQTSLSFVSEAFLNEDGWYTTEEDKVKNMIDLVK